VTREKRDWSFVPAAQVRVYVEEGLKLVALAEQHKLSAFGAALAGVALIRNVIAIMGGKPEWWCKQITSTKPFADFVEPEDS
jgi:hypothetical protein